MLVLHDSLLELTNCNEIAKISRFLRSLFHSVGTYAPALLTARLLLLGVGQVHHVRDRRAHRGPSVECPETLLAVRRLPPCTHLDLLYCAVLESITMTTLPFGPSMP